MISTSSNVYIRAFLSSSTIISIFMNVKYCCTLRPFKIHHTHFDYNQLTNFGIDPPRPPQDFVIRNIVGPIKL